MPGSAAWLNKRRNDRFPGIGLIRAECRSIVYDNGRTEETTGETSL